MTTSIEAALKLKKDGFSSVSPRLRTFRFIAGLRLTYRGDSADGVQMAVLEV